MFRRTLFGNSCLYAEGAMETGLYAVYLFDDKFGGLEASLAREVK